MDLKEIAAVSGKGGLFKVLKPTRAGVILESIDEQKSKVVVGAQQKVSLLKEISIYTTGKDSSIALEEVLTAIHAKYGLQIPVNAKSSSAELTDFIESVVPNYDTDRVYTSDIKKLANWYTIIATHIPEYFDKKEQASEEKPEKETKEAQEEAEAKKA